MLRRLFDDTRRQRERTEEEQALLFLLLVPNGQGYEVLGVPADAEDKEATPEVVREAIKRLGACYVIGLAEAWRLNP